MAAGIEPSRKADKHPKDYYKINRDLTYQTAVVAKAYGVKQFIVLSSLDVYGTKLAKVTEHSQAYPETDYAKSKYEADQKITALSDNLFCVCILRLPIVTTNGKESYFSKLNFLLPGSAKRRKEKVHIDKVCSLIHNFVIHNTTGIMSVAE